MQVSKEAILRKTHYGLNVYSHILSAYYPGQTVLSLRGRDCQPARNPFNGDKPTLKVQVIDNCASHLDLEDAVPAGDFLSFAARHYGLEGQELLDKLDEELHLHIANPVSRGQYNPVPPGRPDWLDPVEPPQFSYYKAPIRNVLPDRNLTPFEAYALIRSDARKATTETLRAITNPKEARQYKAANFPYVTFSGTFNTRSDKELIRHSGFMVLDFDHLPNLSDTRQRLMADEYFDTVLLFTSPSGDGLKWVISVDLTNITHADLFRAIAAYIKSTYGLEVDPSGKDVSRACFLPYDPSVYLNPRFQ